MKRILIVLLIVFVQETVTLNGLLVKSHQGYYSWLVITVLFLVATVLEIFFGYWFGTFVKQRWNRGRVRIFARKWADRFKEYIGRHGRRIYLLLLGYFSFPYLNAFICAWLNIPFEESFRYLFFGNMLFYITSWLLVLGVMSVVPNPFVAFAVVIALTIIVTIVMRLWKSRKI